jgi:hypothetical protein
MKAKLNPTFEQLSGKLSNIVFKRVGLAQVVTKFTKNSPLTSVIPLAYKSSYHNLSQIWQVNKSSLYPIYLSYCSSYVFHDRFGNEFYPTPYQLFLYLNLSVFKFTGSIIDSPGICVNQPLAQYNSFGFRLISQTFRILITSSLPAASHYAFYCTKQKTQPPYPTKKDMKLIYNSYTAQNHYVDLYPYFTTRFPMPLEGLGDIALTVDIVNEHSGQRSGYNVTFEIVLNS